MPDTTISEGNWLITVAGIPGTFQAKTGGEVAVEHTKERDGGALVPNVSQGPPNISDLTVSRSYQVPRDQALVKTLAATLAAGRRFEAVVTCQSLNEQMVPVGSPDIYDCVLQKVSPRDANASSAQNSRFELLFTARSMR
jgi:hypothetical protein